MIEFPITLTSGGSVCLPGHASALALGYAKNKSVYRLAVTATGEWAGLTIRAFWHVPGGSDPASSLVEDGTPMPPPQSKPRPMHRRPQSRPGHLPKRPDRPFLTPSPPKRTL